MELGSKKDAKNLLYLILGFILFCTIVGLLSSPTQTPLSNEARHELTLAKYAKEQHQKAVDRAHGELYYQVHKRIAFPNSHKSIHKSEVICKDHMIIMRRFSCRNAFGQRSTHDASLHSNLSGTKFWNIVIN